MVDRSRLFELRRKYGVLNAKTRAEYGHGNKAARRAKTFDMGYEEQLSRKHAAISGRKDAKTKRRNELRRKFGVVMDARDRDARGHGNQAARRGGYFEQKIAHEVYERPDERTLHDRKRQRDIDEIKKQVEGGGKPVTTRQRILKRLGIRESELKEVQEQWAERAEKQNATRRNPGSRARHEVPWSRPKKTAPTGYKPLFWQIKNVEPTRGAQKLVVEEAEQTRDVVARYLRRVGNAFKDSDSIRSAAGKAVDIASNFFDTVMTKNPLSPQERRLINVLIEKGPDGLSEAEHRIVVSAIAHTDDINGLSELARLFDPSITNDIGTTDIMRLRRFLSGRLLGDKGFRDLQKITKSIRDQDVSPATVTARNMEDRKKVTNALLDIDDDPRSAASQSSQSLLDQASIRRKAGVTKVNVAAVQQQVTADGHQIGFDNIVGVSIDEILQDRQKPIQQRKYRNMFGYTTEELVKMRANGQSHIGLGIRGGEEVELALLKGYGSDGTGKKINVVYHASHDQIKSLLAADADRVVSIDMETTFGTRPIDHGLDVDDIDQLVSDEADKRFKKTLTTFIREAEQDPEIQRLGGASKLNATRRKVAERIAQHQDDSLSRLRSIAYVTASRRQRETMSDVNMSEYVDQTIKAKSKQGSLLKGSKFVGMNVTNLDELRKAGKVYDVGSVYVDYIEQLEQKVKQGYRVEGLNIHRADLEWFRRDAYLTANEIIYRHGDNEKAVAIANRLLAYTGEAGVDADGNLTWGKANIIKDGVITEAVAGHDLLLPNTHDITRDIRAYLPGSFYDKKSKKYVRGYDLGDGQRVTVKELRGRVAGVVQKDFDTMYQGLETPEDLLRGIREKEGLRSVATMYKADFKNDDEFDVWLKDLQRDTDEGLYDDIARRWKDQETGNLDRALREGAGASADELYVLFHDDLAERGLTGTRHSALEDAKRAIFFKQKARLTAMKTRNVVIRTIEDRLTNRIGNAVNAIEEFVGKAKEPIKVMLTDPKEGSKGAYQNVALYVKDIFTQSERTNTAHRAQMAAAQMAAYGGEVSEALMGSDIVSAANAAKKAFGAASDLTDVAVKAAKQRKGLAAMAVVGIAAMTGTAIRRRQLNDESWRYSPTWTAQDERNYQAKLMDASMGQMTLETSRRRSGHHNMRSDRHNHLFRG